MRWQDKRLKRELMEMIDCAYQDNPRYRREDVIERVLDELHYEKPETNAGLTKISVRYTLEGLVGEYIRRTRRRIKNALLGGQEDSEELGKPPAFEAVNGVILTVPLAAGRTEDIPAVDCTREEVRAARMYYRQQGEAMHQREAFCAALERADAWEGLPESARVGDLYRVA